MKYLRLIILMMIIIYVLSFNCTNKIDCNNMGECSMNKCICNECWIDFEITVKQCNYKQKKQSIVIILSIILGLFGIDHFYIGNYILAILKLLLFSIFIIMYKNIPDKNDISNSKKKRLIPTVILGLMVFIWYINDIILFSQNKYTDINNILLCK
jgi:hypothetical protein